MVNAGFRAWEIGRCTELQCSGSHVFRSSEFQPLRADFMLYFDYGTPSGGLQLPVSVVNDSLDFFCRLFPPAKNKVEEHCASPASVALPPWHFQS